MSDKLKTQRGMARRRTTRRITSRPVRVPEDRLSSRPPPAAGAADGEQEELLDEDEAEYTSVPPSEAPDAMEETENTRNASQPAVEDVADDEVTNPRVEITDTMAMLLGRVSMPDEVDTNPRIRVDSQQEDMPSVVVSPPAQMIGGSVEESFEISVSDTAQTDQESNVEELTLEEGDVEESFSVEGAVQIPSTPPPPPAPASVQKRRPPPPPARSQGPVKRPWWETFFSEDYLSTYVPPLDD